MFKYLLRLTLTSTFILITSIKLISQVKTDTLKSGTGIWKPPVGCNSFYVELWGGGAGGNTGSGDGTLSTGGGGGGSYARSNNFSVTSSTFISGYQYSIGAGGGLSLNGGDTWFASSTNYLAPGGNRRGTNQRKSPVNSFIASSYFGGGGGSSWRNIFNQIWQGGGGASGRRVGDGYVGGNADNNYTGGGAEGGAYNDGNASIGRGGQDGPYFPGVPGGVVLVTKAVQGVLS